MKHCKGKNSLKLFLASGKNILTMRLLGLQILKLWHLQRLKYIQFQWNLYLRVIMTVLAFLAMNSHPQGS